MENIIQITGPQITIILIAIAVLQFLLANWIRSRLENSIRHEYDKRIEDYKFEFLKREQAARVAELVSLWKTVGDKELNRMTGIERSAHCQKLNKLAWELAIWIPDEKLVKNFMNRLKRISDADFKEILFNTRQQVQGKQDTELKYDDLVYFE